MQMLNQKAAAIEEWTENHLIDPDGVVYSQVDKSGRPLTEAFFDPISRKKLPDVSLTDFWKYENCGMTTGAYLQALVCRYEAERDPAALEHAKRCYQALRHIYELGKELEEGFFPKIYGARFSRQTSTDQVLYATMALDKYAPHANTEERDEIARMIANMIRFWVKRKYHFGYFHIPDMLWPLARFPSLLLLAFNHSGEKLFKDEYDRLLAEGVNRFPGESRLRPKLAGEVLPTEYEKQQHAWLIHALPDAVTMDVMELDYLLRHDPDNSWAETWRKSISMMWNEGRLALAPNGKAYTHVLVDMDTGLPRRPDPSPGVPGAETGWSTMIARAGIQAATHLPEQRENISNQARRVLEALDIADLTYFDEPERFGPEEKFKTRFISGDAVTNWLWAYWQGKKNGFLSRTCLGRILTVQTMEAIKRIALVLLANFAWRATAIDRYVAPGGTNDSGNGYNTWAGAATQIEWAVAVAGAGETVWVSNGIYYLTNQIAVGNIKLRSWPDGSSLRDTTIVNGNYPAYTNRCFLLNNAAALVEGFTITNSCSSGIAQGSAVTIMAGTLRNCIVTGNITTDATHSAGVYLSGASSVATNCRIEANIGYRYGAGVYLTSSAKLFNCRVVSNQTTAASSGRGAGIHMDGGSLVDGCYIIGNMSTNGTESFGGGIFSDGGTVRNCLIARNSSFNGAVYFRGVSVMENCTVVSNYSGNQPGIVLNAASACPIRNVIAWRNRYSAALDIDIWDMKSATAPTYYTNCAFGNVYDAAAPAAKPWRGVNNIDLSTVSPGFVDPQTGNYRLQKSSPCVNAGIYQAWMAGSLDLDGRTRIDRFFGIVDMGCYEYLPGGVMFKAY